MLLDGIFARGKLAYCYDRAFGECPGYRTGTRGALTGGGRAAAGTSFARHGEGAPRAPGGARTEGTGVAHGGRGGYGEGAHSEGARGDGAGCWMLSQIRNRGHSANARGLLEGLNRGGKLAYCDVRAFGECPGYPTGTRGPGLAGRPGGTQGVLAGLAVLAGRAGVSRGGCSSLRLRRRGFRCCAWRSCAFCRLRICFS